MTETSRPVDERRDNIPDSEGKALYSLILFHGENPKNPTSVHFFFLNLRVFIKE